MILRRPYAFLIKYFKIIHLLMAIISLYIFSKTNAIYSFFKTYISNNYTAVITEGFAKAIIPNILYIITFVLILIITAVIFLLLFKSKKQKIYTIYLIYYIIFFIALFFYSGVLNSLEREVISADVARVLRDVSLFLYLIQIYFIIILSVRAIGFNVRHFEFEKDIKDLNITDKDSEEIEISVELETYKAKRTLRRFIREFLYYIKENLFIFLILAFIGVIVILRILLNSSAGVSSKTYNESISFYHEGLLLNVEESINTPFDLGGNIIKKDKSYIVIKLNLKNTLNKEYFFKKDIFKLYNSSKNKYYTPNLTKSELFFDIGANINKQLFKYNHEGVYSIPFEIEKSELRDKFELRMYSGVIVKNNVTYPIFNKVKLKPFSIDSFLNEGVFKLNDTIIFNNSYIGKSSLYIKDYSFTDNYIYNFEVCIKSECIEKKDVITLKKVGEDSNKTLMVIDGSFDLNKTTEYYKNTKNNYDFWSDFAKVEYISGGISLSSRVEAVYKENLKGKIVLKVPKEVKESEVLNLVITVRNKVYRFLLKEVNS